MRGACSSPTLALNQKRLGNAVPLAPSQERATGSARSAAALADSRRPSAGARHSAWHGPRSLRESHARGADMSRLAASRIESGSHLPIERDRKKGRKALAAVPVRSRVPRTPTKCREYRPREAQRFRGFSPVFARIRDYSRTCGLSGRPDSNRGPQAPKACALTRLRYAPTVWASLEATPSPAPQPPARPSIAIVE